MTGSKAQRTARHNVQSNTFGPKDLLPLFGHICQCFSLLVGRHGELDETEAFPPGFLIHAGCHDKNQMRKTLSGLHNGKNKRRNQMENKQEQGD